MHTNLTAELCSAAKSEFHLASHALLHCTGPLPATLLHDRACPHPPLHSVQQHQGSTRMISDVTLSALANWLGSLTMILIVLYHVSHAIPTPTDLNFEWVEKKH